jgi:hypothetical protein
LRQSFDPRVDELIGLKPCPPAFVFGEFGERLESGEYFLQAIHVAIVADYHIDEARAGQQSGAIASCGVRASISARVASRAR